MFIEGVRLERGTTRGGDLVIAGTAPTAQPLGQRNSETLLSTSERFFGQPIPHGLFEQPFPLSVSQLEATGQPPAEFDEIIVQENGTRLQRHHHASPI